MTNEQIIKAYITKSKPRSNSKKSLWFDGDVLYSYATPIAYRLPNGNILCSYATYSPTTQRHLSLLRRHADRPYQLKYYYTHAAGRYDVPAGTTLADLVTLNLPWVKEQQQKAEEKTRRARTDTNRMYYFLKAASLEELASNLNSTIGA